MTDRADDGAIGLDGFAADAEAQARFFEKNGISVYSQAIRALARLAEEDPAVRGALARAWGARAFHAPYERPLLLLAALRQDALAEPAHPLARAFAVAPEEERVTDDALREALADGRPALGALAARFVQTNEVSRAIAWRLPLGVWDHGARDVTLVDLGCSAGLNLVADRVEGLGWTDEIGAPVPLAPTSRVARRVGLDRAPIDVRDARERAWLRACLWPGQRARHERLERALAAASRALDAGEIELIRADARDFPAHVAGLARGAGPGGRVLAYQTVFSAYLDPAARAAYEAEMRALAETPRVARVATVMWSELEAAAHPTPEAPAELRLHDARGTRVLARCAWHPSVLMGAVRGDSCAPGQGRLPG